MKNKNKLKLTFCGMSSEDVTNSMYLLEYNDKKILLDCGLFQSGSPNVLKSYKINTRNTKIPYKYLDAIFISHANVDHVGLVPLAYKKGAICPTFIPKNNTKIIEIMFADSLKIFESDSEKLQRKYNVNANLIYEPEDVETCLSNITEIDFNVPFKVFEDTTLTLYHAGHIINAAQMHFEFIINNVKKTLTYTGDIGSDISKDYTQPYSPTPFADIMIAESTYAGDKRNHSEKDRIKDIEKIKTVVQQCCIDSNNKVLFGVFSLDRLQNVLTDLYKVYGEDESFVIPIIIDAPLGIKLCKIYSDVVEKNSVLWEKVMSWKNIVWINEYETSRYYQSIKTPQIILSTSNMLSAGRILGWVKSILPNINDRIMFCGYTGDTDSLAWKIKNNKKFVEIDGERISNKAGITCLNSFSSHASRQELLYRYASLPYNKIFLVHGEMSGKTLFAEELRKKLSKNNRSAKVCLPAMTDEFNL